MAHCMHVTCHNLRVFFVDPFIQNVLSLKSCVQISNRFHHWIARVESFKLDPTLTCFDEFYFLRKNIRKTKAGALFFLSERGKTMPLAEANLCLYKK